MVSGKGCSRRKFLRFSGVTASVLVAGGLLPNFGLDVALATDLGEGDVGVLNYAYALEQLEAEFYTKVTDSPFTGITPQEAKTFAEIRDHEIAHREFFKTTLGGKAISEIEVDFSGVNFNNRASVLDCADSFENLGVAAYNGVGHLIKNVDYLVATGTIVSVEARHAAMIAELLHGPSAASAGAGHISTQGLDAAMPPREVLAKAKPFIKTPLMSAFPS
jgi:hypothetical protein